MYGQCPAISREEPSATLFRNDPFPKFGEFWNEEAKALIAGVIMHVTTHPPPEGPTLGAV